MSPRTGIMLATPVDARLLTFMPAEFLVQPKLDGDRCRAVPHSSGYSLVSSQGTSREFAVPHIPIYLNRAAEETYGDYTHWPILDGELYIDGVSHQQLRSIVSRTVSRHPNHTAAHYHVFDTISPTTQLSRLFQLSRLSPHLAARPGPVHIVQSISSPNSMDDVHSWMHAYIGLGYEGVIIRHPYGLYEFKRSRYLLKAKPTKIETASLTGFSEAVSLDGDPKGMVGSFFVRSPGGVDFLVGAGKLTHNQRIRLWNEKPFGVRIEYRYLTLTDAGLPREPVCTRVLMAGDVSYF